MLTKKDWYIPVSKFVGKFLARSSLKVFKDRNMDDLDFLKNTNFSRNIF